MLRLAKKILERYRGFLQSSTQQKLPGAPLSERISSTEAFALKIGS